MFILSAVLCLNMEATSCMVDVYSKESYITLEQCEKSKVEQIEVLSTLGFAAINVGCFEVPKLAGETA